MESSQLLSLFQSFIHQHYLDVLHISPMESLTPFEVENELTGEKSFIFIGKCSPYIYEPVKGRDIQQKNDISFSMYIEKGNLIIRFELLDMMLESEIVAHKAHSFLSSLIHQEKLSLAIVDGNSYQLIWFTNAIPFKTIQFHYEEIFKRYHVI